MARKKKIEGIYNFADKHRSIITNELNKIPHGTLVNYKKNHIFGIKYDDGMIPIKNLRVYTKLPGDNSSQGHVYITEDDNILYLNNSKIVMDVIIDTYMIEKREQKLNELGI